MFSKLGFISTAHNYKRVFIDKAEFEASLAEYESSGRQVCTNYLTIGWQHLNLLSHPNATLAPQGRQARAIDENLNYVTLAPQARQARASGENLNYVTPAPQARQARPSGEILNFSLSC